MNTTALDALPWRHDLPPEGTIVLRAGPGDVPMLATWTACEGWEGGGFYELWGHNECGELTTFGYVPRGEVVSAGWEWMGVGVG